MSGRGSINRRSVVLSAAVLAATAAFAPARAQEPGERRELYRIRIENQAGGAVELSSDGGDQWQPLGKVTRPATAAANATPVLGIAGAGTVAGVGPEHLLLRLPNDKNQNRSLRVTARGEPATSTSISTDIPARGSLFRCIAPPVGTRVLLSRDTGTTALPAAYIPKAGDRLVLRVLSPEQEEPPSVTIENKEGGEVVYAATGGIPKVLAHVKQPLRGIGRYDGTQRAGTGSVVCWTPTTVMVSTSATARRVDENGETGEERGGFVVQPAEPRLQGATHLPSQLLVEGVPEGDTPPVISRFFGLPVPVTNGDPTDAAPMRVDVRIDNGDWEPLPDLRGAINAENFLPALQQALDKDKEGKEREVKEGITHLRFSFPHVTDAGVKRRLRLATAPAADQPQRGKVTITANVMGEGVTFVSFVLDGRQVKLTNLAPFAWEWDTRGTPNGEHLLEIRGLDARGVAVTTVVTKVLVDN